jgi:excisionase family DNA binding protein
VSVTIHAKLNGTPVPLVLDETALAALAAAIDLQSGGTPTPESPLLSVAEAAAFLRCKRQRVDDLLYQRRLTRVKEGRRTLIRRDELEQHLRASTESQR